MANFIVIVILVLIVGLAIRYLYKARKSGVKCIGCPSGCNCASREEKAEDASCGCGCGGSKGECNCHAETK